MTLGNPMIGAPPEVFTDDGGGVEPVVAVAATQGAGDGTEYAVAGFVIAALAVLILFRAAGFQAVIAARVG